MKTAYLLSLLLILGTSLALADSPDHGGDFTGTYVASLPTRAEILQLHGDGTAEITLSDQVTSGAGGFTFSDSFGSWKVTGPRKLTARFLNLNFDVTGPPAFTGIAVVDSRSSSRPTSAPSARAATARSSPRARIRSIPARPPSPRSIAAI